MRFCALCDHRCRARSADRTRNLKFALHTYANASSQRIHRVNKRLHKACAKRPETLSSEKSVNWAFFSLPSFLEAQRSQQPRAHVSSHQPRPKAAAPPQQWGWLVRAIVVRAPTSRARRRHSAFPMPQRQRSSTSTASETRPPTPRSARRTHRCNQRFAGHGEMGDRGPVAPFAASGWREPSLAPTQHHSTLAFSATHNHTTHAKPTDHHDSITSSPGSAQSPRAGAAVAKSAGSH